MYPIMKLTNLSPIFFIIISLILLPQIYENARRGQRPNLENAYYTKFLTFRYLLIVSFLLILVIHEMFPLEYILIIA